MRYYVTASKAPWWAVVPEVPGVAAEDCPTREEAIERCRRRATAELRGFRALGYEIDLDPAEEVVEWSAPWWLIPEWLVPAPPALVRAAVRRMDQTATEVEEFLAAHDRNNWDIANEGWSIRRIVDHVSGGFGIGLRRLEPWPLDPDEAQADALTALIERVRQAPTERVEQIGLNSEAGRVRWTPAKVVRVVGALQEGWRSHAVGNAPEPTLPQGHEDVAGDDEPVKPQGIEDLVRADAELRALAKVSRRVRSIASSYRYYRDRLISWPSGELERWRAMRSAFQDRLLELDESELALVRLAPSGQCETVRMELGLGLSHVREHLEQMRSTLPR